MKKILLVALMLLAPLSAHARSCGACGPGGDNCIHGNWGYYCIHDFPSGCYMYEDDLCAPGGIPGFTDDTAYDPKRVTDLEVSDSFYVSGHTADFYVRHSDGTKALVESRWVPEKKTWAAAQLKTIYR